MFQKQMVSEQRQSAFSVALESAACVPSFAGVIGTCHGDRPGRDGVTWLGTGQSVGLLSERRGVLTPAGVPVSSLQAATKGYVDGLLSVSPPT